MDLREVEPLNGGGKHPPPDSNATPHWSRYAYDPGGRLIWQEAYQNGKQLLTINYSYDAEGNQTAEGEWAPKTGEN